MANVHIPYPGRLCGQKIYNPKVPFEQCLGNLYPGKMIFVTGTPDPDCPRFTVDLESVHCEKTSIAFHFDVRLDYGGDKNTIVRNALLNGNWGQEERGLSTPFPFNRNDFFEMIILVEESCFKVAVNDRHLLEFKHRFPIEKIDTLRITGDLKLATVRIQG